MSEPRYFRIGNDMDTQRRALVSFAMDDESQDAAFSLMHERRWDGPPPHVEVGEEGPLLDWSLVIGTSVPLVSARAADAIARLARPAVQRIPVALPGVDGGWELLGIRTIDCADGNPRDVIAALSPVIDLGRTAGSTIFHLPSLIVVVREEIFDAFREHQFTGARFVPAATR